MLRLPALLLLLLHAGVSSPTPPPNILLIMADDLGMGDLGCFGNTTLRTPALDRLAAEGARLSHHLAPSSVCTPSRAAFLTGRYPIKMGMVPHNLIRVNIFTSNVAGLPPEEHTFAEMAKDQGYTTAFYGKWHLGVHCDYPGDYCHHPLHQGFDHFYGLPLTNLRDYDGKAHLVLHGRYSLITKITVAAVVGALTLLFFAWKLGVVGGCCGAVLAIIIITPLVLLLGIFHHMHLWTGIVMRDLEVVEQPVQLQGFTHRLVTEGQEFLTHRAEDKKPFLLVMSWLQVHTAMHSGRPFKGRSKHGRFGDEVEEMDWSVGEMLSALDLHGFTNNTFVYFTSDNGGHVEEVSEGGRREGGFNGIYRGGKGQGGMEGGIRVPTVVRWPGHVPPHSEISVPTSMMDIKPTLAAVMGAPAPSGIDGHNILPLLVGRSQTSPHKVLIHYCMDVIHAARYVADKDNVYKVHYMTPNWEAGTEGCGFICGCKGGNVMEHDPPLMYNIQQDPSEQRLLDVTQDQHRHVLALINTAVTDHHASFTHPTSQYSIGRLMPRPWLQQCCNFPSCHCEDSKYTHLYRKR